MNRPWIVEVAKFARWMDMLFVAISANWLFLSKYFLRSFCQFFFPYCAFFRMHVCTCRLSQQLGYKMYYPECIVFT